MREEGRKSFIIRNFCDNVFKRREISSLLLRGSHLTLNAPAYLSVYYNHYDSTHKTNKAVSTIRGTRISERVFCDYNHERIRACRNRWYSFSFSSGCLNLHVTSALYIFIARVSPLTRSLWRIRDCWCRGEGSRDGQETNEEKKGEKKCGIYPRDESRPRECDGHLHS